MNCVIHSGRTRVQMSLGLVALSFSSLLTTRADVPVITNPQDLRFYKVNETFDPFALSPGWVEKAPMPTARIGFATVALNGKIYVIGGRGANSDICESIQTVEAYDTGTDTWERGLAEPPTLRYRGAGAALGGLIYLVGGEARDVPNECGEAVATVEAYDPLTNTWSTKASLNVARSQSSLAVDEVNNKLYAIGGSNGRKGGFVAKNVVEVYDPSQDTWTQVTGMNTARSLSSVGVIAGKIYALGGQDANNLRISTIEDYDIATDLWTLHGSAESIMPFPYLNPAPGIIKGKIYIVGGEGSLLINAGPEPTVQVYDPATDSWTTSFGNASLPPMPGGRRNHGAAVVNDILYAIGGESANATENSPLTYQITATNNPDSFGVSGLPDGLTLVDDKLGIISGTPTIHSSEIPVIFSATNPDGAGSKAVNFYVLKDQNLPPEALRIVSGTCATARAGQPFSFQVLTSNATGDAIISANGLPYTEGVGPQLTINQDSGLITGTVTPTSDNKPQSFGVTLAVSDLDGTATTQSLLQLTFITEPIPTVPIISSQSTVTLPLNKFFSYTITADAPASSFDFIGTDGNLGGTLPADLAFDKPTHTISGIYAGETTVQPSRAPNGESIETIKKEPPPKSQTCGLGNGTDTGTAPLVFIPSLHDYEIEALPTITSLGTEYSVFTDDSLTSGTGAGLLKSTLIGEFVTYTVPVPVAGTYDVSVGIKTNKGKAIFQLYIDGVPQGAPQDEYSPRMEHDVRDLGTRRFKAGNSSFKFLVVDKNPLSINYQLVFDYIDLIPRGEAEKLKFTSSTNTVRVRDVNFSGRQGRMLNATTMNDFVSYTVPVPVDGLYNIQAKTRTGSTNGIFQLAVDGVNLGYTQDEYTVATSYEARDLGTIFLAEGNSEMKFTVTGRNPSSTGYALIFDYIDLVLSSQSEAETLPETATAPISTITDPVMSGGQGLLLKARAVNDSITYTLPVPVSGTYHIKVGSRTGSKSGKFQLLVDGINQGIEQDQYSALTGYHVYDLGSINFPGSGSSAFQFLVIDKNPGSTGYQLLFDYIEFVR